MKAMNFILLICFLMMSSTCENDKKDKCHKIIKMVNQSDKAIYAEYTFGYPDTTYFKYEPNPTLSPEVHKVSPGETNTIALWSRSCWKDKFDAYIPSDTLMIYVFDAEVLETTPWDTVVSNYMVLRRYDLSLQDLKNIDWTITYP